MRYLNYWGYKMSSFAKSLWEEIRKNAKTVIMTVGIAVIHTPLTSFPGLNTAVTTALADRTPASYVDVGIQALIVIAASMRAGKIVKDAAIKSAEN